MALLDDVKSELAAIDNELPAAKKAQATAMIRFGGGLRLVQRQIIVQAQFDSLKAAQWLQDTIRDLYGHEAVMTQVSRSTPNGATVQRYMIHVERGGAALALQTGLLDRRKRLVRGLPADIISGNIAQVKAAWRGASWLMALFPTRAKPASLKSSARRTRPPSRFRAPHAGSASRRNPDSCAVRSVSRSRTPTHRAHAHPHGRPALRKGVDRQAHRRRGTGQGEPSGELRRRQHAPQREGRCRSSEKVRRAFEILGDDIPENLRAAGQLRLEHGDASLEELGRLADPPITKDAIAGRIRRLLQLADKTAKTRDREQSGASVGR